MNVLIIGSGGREHAIALKLYEESNNVKIFLSPGNGGTQNIAKNIELDLNNLDLVKDYCLREVIDLVVIGPEQPLVDGLADYLRKEGINVFGPNKKAARIEGNKKFAKELMYEYNIPTASFKTFNKNNYVEAIQYLKDGSFPIVLKASGLAAGKGVIIAENFIDAENSLNDMINNAIFGSAGDEVVIEEFLEGEELSVFVVTDGKEYVILPPSQDHKRIGEGDTGKNTGGMGAYSPLKIVNEKLIKEIETNVIIPTLKGLSDKSSTFNGCLYCGLINTKQGIKVIEYNCRFGDPEIQAVLQLIDGDFYELLNSTSKGNVNKSSVSYNNKSAVCVVSVSGGYPDSYEKGFEINGIPKNTEDLKIIHAGTKSVDEKIVTNGGRVLNIVSSVNGNDVKQCLKKAYDVLDKVNYNKIYYRKDIAYKAIK